MSDHRHGIATRTVRGMAWAYGAYVGGRLLVLVATAILARLLTPSDFGTVALALTFMVFLDAVRDLGLGQALILHNPGEEEARAQTAFSWGVVIGLTLSLATAALSPLAASFFRQPDLAGILPVLGSTFLIRSLGATHLALARKQLNYRVRTIAELSEVTVRGIVGIVLALLGAGAWSLVIGFVSGAAVFTVALWVLVSFRPRFRLSGAHLRDMLAFGGVLTLVDISAVFAYNMDYLFVGRVLGAAALGFYSMAYRLPELAIVNMATVAGDVLFPAYAQVDRERLRDAYLIALRYTAMLTVPVAVGLIALARPVIVVLFGETWTPSIEVMQVLAAYSLCVTLGIPAGTVFKVTRQAWILVAFGIPGIAVLAALLFAFTDEGIMTVAICTIAIQIVELPLVVLVASRRLRLRYSASVRAIAPATFAGAAMAAALVAVERTIAAPVPALLVGGALGVAVYAGALALLARDDLRRLRDMALPRFAEASG